MKGSMRAPGKNHPLVGAWLVTRWAQPGGVCADPMIGVGGLWLRTNGTVGRLYGCEIEPGLCALARDNLPAGVLVLSQGDARSWKPPEPVNMVLFSPPFLQNHSAGATAHQQEIRERKRLHTMQEFGSDPANLGSTKSQGFWSGMGLIYKQARLYLAGGGHLAVVLRNRIRKRRETNEVGEHIRLIRGAGFDLVGVHPRDLDPRYPARIRPVVLSGIGPTLEAASRALRWCAFEVL
ncbi:MAG: hypothetical protein HY815_24920 [Candidatus Riflebacteria bacterium]|nr:hypothetical protein [Candidatus Riflebacteria bacterium]